MAGNEFYNLWHLKQVIGCKSCFCQNPGITIVASLMRPYWLPSKPSFRPRSNLSLRPWSIFRTIEHCWMHLPSTTQITNISFSCSSRSARAFSLTPAVFQKLFDCVSGVKWLKSSAFLPIHWLLCEELWHSLSFCAFFRPVEPVLKFQSLDLGI